MKPHQLFYLTNRLMVDLPPDLTEDELKEIGCSFIARAKFLKGARDPFMRAEMLKLLQAATMGE
jgi:hypothetical protein